MTGFEFLFSFYGLLLGLAVANVAANLADMWRGRDEIVVGILPPLIGVLILLTASEQWLSFWGGRDALTMGAGTVVTSLCMALPYIFVSHAMFPYTPQKWPSLEEYCLENRRVLMGVLAIPPLVSTTANLVLSDAPTIAEFLPAFLIVQAPRLAILLLLAISGNRWVHRLGLTLLCLHMIFLIFASG